MMTFSLTPNALGKKLLLSLKIQIIMDYAEAVIKILFSIY